MAGKVALPHVHAVLAAWLELVPPGEDGPLQPAPRRVLPLRLGRQPLARPTSERRGVVPRHVDDGVVEPGFDVVVRSGGMLPVGAEDLSPPRRLRDAARVGEVVGEQPAEHERPAEALALGDVTRGLHERTERLVGHRRAVDGERGERHLAHRALAVLRVGPLVVAAHRERAAVQHHHRPGRLVRRCVARRRRRGRGPLRGRGFPVGRAARVAHARSTSSRDRTARTSIIRGIVAAAGKSHSSAVSLAGGGSSIMSSMRRPASPIAWT